MALILDLVIKRLLVVIVTERQGLQRGRPLTESSTVVLDRDADGYGNQR